jgi:hypothetical protein
MVLRASRSRELQAAILGFKAADRDLKKRIRDVTKREVGTMWRDAVLDRAVGPWEQFTYGKAKPALNTGNPPTLRAAQSRTTTPGGYQPDRDFYMVEFGSGGKGKPQKTEYPRRSRKGGTHPVKRDADEQMPHRRRTGRVGYRAISVVAPRIVALWVATIVREYARAADAKVV